MTNQKPQTKTPNLRKQSPERKPYDPGMCDKRNLVRWVKDQFPQLTEFRTGRLQTYPDFEQRLPEVHAAVMHFLDRIQTMYRPGDGTRMYEYYLQDIERLPADFEKGDARKYADHLKDLIFGIEEE